MARRRWFARMSTAFAAAAVLSACGGGGGGSAPPPSPPPPPPAPAPVTKAQLDDASRFLSRAGFGARYEQLEPLVRQTKSAWLDEQFALPITEHQQVVDELFARRDRGDFDVLGPDVDIEFSFRRLAWWHATVTAEDVLRQRVAFALSQIFVVSDRVDTLIVFPYALSNYYDMLLTHAFGNYRDLLRAVTLHPAMGVYLSHLNNNKSDPVNNIFPDENYAREVMQLFSIGLFELDIDGRRTLDADGNAIPTYGNDQIREFAKIFTGLTYGAPNTDFPGQIANFRVPMQMFDAFHEAGEKRLLNGALVPAGQTGMQDLEAAIDNLFEHPNVGPFFARHLIQKLVTSNPSPAYVERVARAFNGETGQPRGDMRAVLRAVLLDPEAEAPSVANGSFGKLREPVERYVALLRQFGATSADGFVGIGGYLVEGLARQHPLSAPSVFNFFLPDHAPAGEIASADLVAPEFEITDSSTVVGISNLIDLGITLEIISDFEAPFAPIDLDLSPFMALADDLPALLDRLDTVLTYGSMSDATREAIATAVADIDDDTLRVRSVIYLFLISPDYVVRH